MTYDEEQKKYKLVINPNTPVCILEELSKNEESWVRRYVAKNPNTPASILEELSKDKNRGVQFYVVLNPNTSKKTLISFLENKDNEIRRTAYKKLEMKI